MLYIIVDTLKNRSKSMTLEEFFLSYLIEKKGIKEDVVKDILSYAKTHQGFKTSFFRSERWNEDISNWPLWEKNAIEFWCNKVILSWANAQIDTDEKAKRQYPWSFRSLIARGEEYLDWVKNQAYFVGKRTGSTLVSPNGVKYPILFEDEYGFISIIMREGWIEHRELSKLILYGWSILPVPWKTLTEEWWTK